MGAEYFWREGVKSTKKIRMQLRNNAGKRQDRYDAKGGDFTMAFSGELALKGGT